MVYGARVTCKVIELSSLQAVTTHSRRRRFNKSDCGDASFRKLIIILAIEKYKALAIVGQNYEELDQDATAAI